MSCAHLHIFLFEAMEYKVQASLCVGVVHAHGYPCLCPDVFYVGVKPFANSPHTVRGTCLPAHVSVCDIFFLPSCFPQFALSAVNIILVLRVCVWSVSSVTQFCFSGSLRDD